MLNALKERLSHFRLLLLENKPKARQVLSRLLHGPMLFKPEEDGRFSVVGETVLGPLLPANAISCRVSRPR
jgi:hypothetical protein